MQALIVPALQLCCLIFERIVEHSPIHLGQWEVVVPDMWENNLFEEGTMMCRFLKYWKSKILASSFLPRGFIVRNVQEDDLTFSYPFGIMGSSCPGYVGE